MDDTKNKGGRPAFPIEDKGLPRTVRLTPARWEKLKRLGTAWLNKVIDAAKESPKE